MNIRQQKYKKNRVMGMNMYNAAIAAGYSKHSATKAHRIEKKLDSLSNYLERAGLTDKRIAEILAQAVIANKVIGYLHQYRKGDKGRIGKISPDEAVSNEFIEVPDWQVRLKAIDLIAKMDGKISASQTTTTTERIIIIKTDNGSQAKTISR